MPFYLFIFQQKFGFRRTLTATQHVISIEAPRKVCQSKPWEDHRHENTSNNKPSHSNHLHTTKYEHFKEASKGKMVKAKARRNTELASSLSMSKASMQLQGEKHQCPVNMLGNDLKTWHCYINLLQLLLFGKVKYVT